MLLSGTNNWLILTPVFGRVHLACCSVLILLTRNTFCSSHFSYTKCIRDKKLETSVYISMFSGTVVTERLSIAGHTTITKSFSFFITLGPHVDYFESLDTGSCITYEFHFRIAKRY